MLDRNPFPGETIHPGPYRMGKNVEDANTYRVGHPLAQRVLARARRCHVHAEVTFDYTGSGKNIAILEPLGAGAAGSCACTLLMSALETEDHLILAGVTDDGEVWTKPSAAGSSTCPADGERAVSLPTGIQATLEEHDYAARSGVSGRDLDDRMAAVVRYRDGQARPLGRRSPRLAQGRTGGTRRGLKEAKKAARFAPTLPEKLERQRALRQA